MNVTIHLSDEHAASLASQARAAHMPTEGYLAHMEQALEEALEAVRPRRV